MSQYPDLPQLIGTNVDVDDGTTLERAVSGKARLRSMFSKLQLTANVEHDLDGPDKDLILAHWAAHRGIAFQFKYRADGLMYSLMYVGRPKATPIAGTDRWSVSSTMVSP